MDRGHQIQLYRSFKMVTLRSGLKIPGFWEFQKSKIPPK